DGNSFDLATWLFGCYPDMTKTFKATIQDGPDDNDYLALDETSPADVGGSQFGIGIGDPADKFTDVRVAANFNINPDTSWNYHGLAARVDYFIDNGTITGVPGIVASSYVMVIHYEEGPANIKIELVKAINLDTAIMAEWQPEVPVPGLDHARSHYFVLDVVGQDPTYITGCVYDYKGGPLLVKTPTFVDTSANDPAWEAPNIHNDTLRSGCSGVFGMWESPQPAGFHNSFDDILSTSEGPAAVNPAPTDGATGVPVDAALNWIEAQFATGRELWLGKTGAMEKVDPAPAAATYIPANLELGQAYEWRIDQIGPAGTVTGHTWTFTTADYIIVDDFESYASDAEIRSAWIDNINEPGVEYVFLAPGDNKSMRFEFQNQFEPFFTEITRTFASPQDWTAKSVTELSLSFIGEHENAEHLMYLTLEDAAGQSLRVETVPYAVQTDSWRQWTIELGQFSDAGIDLTSIQKITIGTGDGAASGQAGNNRDHIYIDQIILR
ncbi:MAG: hypothetical protein JW837_08205, partial [Sedimentisphaerales bacterium]|nr:hypothetical protein [Sedimentisphaerales bacterium]